MPIRYIGKAFREVQQKPNELQIRVLRFCQGHAAGSDIFSIPGYNSNTLRNQNSLRFYNAAMLDQSSANKSWLTPEIEGFADDELVLGVSCGCYIERGPKRRQAYIWQCCNCGQGGISIKSEACRSCGYPRCAYCPVSKVRI
ncbi:hypothetical protein LY76DRAFT_527891 [Colletotrichum caudatum]|nr:hypothetical protein LY76DRAFT_527891 [Colletotrichum caudatum]